MKLLSLLVFLFVGSMAHAQGQTTTKESISKNSVKAKSPENAQATSAALASFTGKASGVRLQAILTHIPRIRRDQEDTSEIFLRGDYTINKKNRVRLEQFFTKFYGKYNSEYEFRPDDTVLAHYYTPESKPLGVNLMWRTGVSLPISNASVRDSLITRFTGSMISSKAFFGGRLMVFAIPYARYHWYQFNMSQSGGHRPWYTVGTNIFTTFFLTPKLYLSGSADYNYETQRQSQFDPTPSQVNNGRYRFDVDLGYQWTDRLSSAVSYFQGAKYIQDGRYEVSFFDNEVSRVALNLTYIY